MKILCGIDLGTQSCKVVLYDADTRKILDSASKPIELISENDGTREQKAEWYDEALEACSAQLDPALKGQILALGVSGHQHSLVALDADCKPVYNVKMWCDTSTEAECRQLTELAGGEEALIAKAGLPMRPGYTAPKVMWLKNHRPDAYKRIKHLLLSHDYINWLLTGAFSAEYGDASGTALLDIRTRQWSAEVCALIGPEVLPALPQLNASNVAAGKVSAAAARLYGIPEGAIVAAGGGDNMMSAIGTGAVADGSLSMSLGTSGTLYGYSDKPVIDPSGELAAFCSSTNGWLPLLCTMNCTVASEEFRGLLGLGVKDFDAAAEKAPIGADGVVILPFFNGERTPNLPHGRASLQGITGANFKRENIARAALEAAIFGMKVGLEGFKKLGYNAKEIRLTGGGSRSKIWQSIAANVTGLPVRIPITTEAAAMGGALQALWTLEGASEGASNAALLKIVAENVELGDTLMPNADSVAAYEDAYKTYSMYLKALESLYK
jgi:xylulokinase